MLIAVLQLRLKAAMTRQHTFLLKCINFYTCFCKQSYDETTQACKQIKISSIQKEEKKHLGNVCACAMCLNLWMTRVEKKAVAILSQGPAHLQHLPDWPDNLQHASLHYQLPPAACRKAQLYFHCLWWCFRVADHSWPVAMADCCLCTTSGPFIYNL